MIKKVTDKWQTIEDNSFRFLAEILVVFLVIFIVIACINSTYRSFVEKAKLTELGSVFSDVKIYFHEYYGYKGRIPDDAEINQYISESGMLLNYKYIVTDADEYYKDGKFEFHLSSEMGLGQERIINLIPVVNDDFGSIIWLCGRAKPPSNIINNARNTTNVSDEILIDICK